LLLQVNFLCKIIPRQIKAENAVSIIRKTVEDLIAKCKEIVESEGERIDADEYVNDADPSILRFLLASREEVRCSFIAYAYHYLTFCLSYSS
jgi:carotene epsilon-monooxygenase